MSEKEPLFPGAEAGRTVHVYRPHPHRHSTKHVRLIEWNVRSAGNPPICLNLQNDLPKFYRALRLPRGLHLHSIIVYQTLNCVIFLQDQHDEMKSFSPTTARFVG